MDSNRRIVNPCISKVRNSLSKSCTLLFTHLLSMSPQQYRRISLRDPQKCCMSLTSITHSSSSVCTPTSGISLHRFTPFSSPPVSSRPSLVKVKAEADPVLNKCVGALVGLAVGDSLGSPLEFLPITAASLPLPDRPRFDLETMSYKSVPPSRFGLKPGQWTDDTSMALCLADSLLESGGRYKGSSTRTKYWLWWNCGLNNAFRKSPGPPRHSVGLGGNIKKSLDALSLGSLPSNSYTPSVASSDAGNGSLMRLAPVPICFHRSMWSAMTMAAQSSFATHPGPIAASACSFLSYLIVKAINDGGEHATSVSFMDSATSTFLTTYGASTDHTVLRVVRGGEPEGGKEECWNWRSPSLPLARTCSARGYAYNGYANTPEYFGSFSADGLAMALNAFYTTKSFDECVAKCANFLGDADTTAAIAGQIAGAFYGYCGIGDGFVERLREWDDDEVALRAVLLAEVNAVEGGGE